MEYLGEWATLHLRTGLPSLQLISHKIVSCVCRSQLSGLLCQLDLIIHQSI
uniref:Uncharacterized protein n=1 Tax=Anguilla anguilla TaxID=7936 RepID=A0A0E9QEW7_ANGAN